MFTLLKLIEPFLLPPTLVAIGMAASLLLLLRKKFRAGITLLVITLLSFYLLATDLGAHLLVKSLETAFPLTSETSPAGAEAIVVLAGGAFRPGPKRPRAELAGESWKRLWRGIELYRIHGGIIPLIYCGGSGDPFNPVAVEPGLASRYALAIGLPKKDVILEGVSRNTFENARALRRLLDEKSPRAGRHRVLLVTSYLHLPRAVRAMEKAGIEAIPAPADFPEGSSHIDYFSFFPRITNLTISTTCIREWVGILGYKSLGRI